MFLIEYVLKIFQGTFQCIMWTLPFLLRGGVGGGGGGDGVGGEFEPPT